MAERDATIAEGDEPDEPASDNSLGRLLALSDGCADPAAQRGRHRAAGAAWENIVVLVLCIPGAFAAVGGGD
jgi:hypothetical protein